MLNTSIDSLLTSIYGSVSAGREKSLFRVTIFFYREPSCGQTMQNKIDFSIDFGWLGIVHSKNVLTYLQKNFWSPVQHPFFSPIDYFLGKNEVRIKPSCDHTLTAGPNLMCPSSWALNSDNFPFFWTLYCSSRTRVTAVGSSVNICWLKFQQILTELPTAVTRVLDEQ